jgi:two-component system, NarL family, sensor histidine kinase UhpB
MDLRVRLTLLQSLIFGATFAICFVYLLADVRQAVRDELRASSDLAVTALQAVVSTPVFAASEAQLTALVARLAHDASIRHLRFELVSGQAAPQLVEKKPERATRDAPAWFAALVSPELADFVHTVPYRQGRIMIVAEPEDEIAEAWRETRTTLLVLLVMCVGASALVFVFLGRALRPLTDVARALAEIERGEFTTRVAAIGLSDIDAITARFNHMAAALAQSHSDNLILAQRSLAIQEQERRHLAHELHDEMGQSITAIKALAVSIRERLESSDTALAERAATITDVCSDIYRRVRRMMARLHPVVLDELGLVAAIELMVDDWNSHHEDCFCSFTAHRDLPPLQAAARIGLYRICQEALTNVARHAVASEVRIELNLRHAADHTSVLELLVADNGRGFDTTVQKRGLGLRGMQERSMTLGGHLHLESARDAGVCLRVSVALALVIEAESNVG